ncbi:MULTISPECIES: allantoinase PuuE [unclassified Aureimonas]|uniref:allantoinase PuuE n=1 Tax=unclassified Aureimonas TaxID=2615206 RepID=UPI0006F4199B|nr:MULTISPECIES: allantoinase PuuE [unclassified Aureimonas]KQT69955.1 polysaccharide deacetylase [Aureimonas sp. Leaf427]KQT75889.1 polysaccharide deacetylase [Aureimonas sp. Leaf460]
MTAPSTRYPRDLRGYGRHAPDPQWPLPGGEGSAKICVQFVVNYEEGGENAILHGDAASEAFLSEIVGAAPWPGMRHMNMESIYEYGARAGFWRLWRMFTERNLPVTVYGVATAMERAPEIVAAMQEADWEIASHGLKWVEYKDATAEHERAHMSEAIALHTAITGERPLGWYTGRSSQHTLDLVAEEGGFLYASDAYADDLPYWQDTAHGPLLILPYTLDSNDMRFATAGGFNSGDQFFAYLRDAFDVLYAEGEAGSAKMLNIGLHCRLVGRPGRAAALARFLDHIAEKPGVWVARRIDIARHWRERFPYAPGLRPSRMDRGSFLARFGGVFEHSPFPAERAFDKGLHDAHDSPAGLSGALTTAFRQASEAERLGVLKAHPDLAGRLALAGDLTPDSLSEQASAGLDRLTPDELARFTQLNEAYVARFGFPFIIAVKAIRPAGAGKAEILKAFETRIGNTRDAEIATATREVEKIARLRIEALFEKGAA